MKTKRGAIIKGAPEGKKSDKRCNPWFCTPIMLIPTKKIVAIPKVTTI